MKGAKLISATGRKLTRMGANLLFDEGIYEPGRHSYALHHTREILGHADQILRDAPVHAIINTHADGDHCWGNQLFARQPIYSTRTCANQIHHHKPIQLTALQWSSKLFSGIPTTGVDAPGRHMTRIQAFDVDVIVPGHGPLATQEDVQQQIDYWEWLHSELAPLATRGVNVDEAAQLCLSSMDFRNSPFAKRPDTERLFTSACTLYREWGIETAKYRGPLQLDHFRRQALLRSATVGPVSATDTFESPRKLP